MYVVSTNFAREVIRWSWTEVKCLLLSATVLRSRYYCKTAYSWEDVLLIRQRFLDSQKSVSFSIQFVLFLSRTDVLILFPNLPRPFLGRFPFDQKFWNFRSETFECTGRRSKKTSVQFVGFCSKILVFSSSDICFLQLEMVRRIALSLAIAWQKNWAF